MTEQALILVADDSKLNLKILDRILRDSSYRTAIVNNGYEALDFIEKELPDLILLDIIMPELNGFAVCKRLKEEPKTKDIPIIFISGITSLDNKVKAFKAGGVDYITKPFQKEEVLARVKTHLKLKEKTVELEKKEEFLKTVIDTVPNLIFVKDLAGNYKLVNKKLADLYGVEKGELIDKKDSNFNNIKESESFVGNYREVIIEEKKSFIPEEKIIDSKGKTRWLETVKLPLKEEGEANKLLGVSTEITTQKNLQLSLNKLDEEQQLLLDNIDLQIWYLKDKQTYAGANRARAEFLGLTKKELKNAKIFNLLDEKENYECVNSNLEVYRKKKKIVSEELATNYRGEKRLLKITKLPKLDEQGEVEFIICYARDITEARKKEEKMRYLTFHDQLTGLYNRNYFKQELERYDVERQLPLTVIIGDVNGLKLVNDAFGHQKGDELLVSISEVIKSTCRTEDLAARWGGDEFIILLAGAKKDAARKICQRIKTEASKKVIADFIKPSISLGYASKTNPKEDFKEVFNRADEMMYQNKFKEGIKFREEVSKALSKKLCLTTDEKEEHIRRLKKYIIRFSQALGLDESSLAELKLLADFHDIGKIIVEPRLFEKKSNLNKKEFNSIKKHAYAGYQIVNSFSNLKRIALDILQHHERWDGNGYPQNLAGEEITLKARIFNIVEAYERMKYGSAYKDTLEQAEIIEELKNEAGKQFDPRLVKEFIAIIND